MIIRKQDIKNFYKYKYGITISDILLKDYIVKQNSIIINDMLVIKQYDFIKYLRKQKTILLYDNK